jgi:hypothetical protein
MSPDHRHTPEEEQRIRDAALDETIAETFPASDAPSSIPNPDNDDALPPDERDPEQRKRRAPLTQQ